MTTLTSNEKSFIAYMQRSDEHLRKGVTLLLEREGFERFFDAMLDVGLFEPNNNPAPIATDDGQYYRVPYWGVLDYLKSCASKSDGKDDTVLAGKVMNVLRNVSGRCVEGSGVTDNYHTHRVFAEILGLVPTSAVKQDDIDLIPLWLRGRFDHGGVCHALDQGVVKRLLDNTDVDDWRKALSVVKHCIAIRWMDQEKYSATSDQKPSSVVDDYWIKELVRHYASNLGSKLGKQAADVFLEWVQEVYDKTKRTSASYLIRPAVEENVQNYDWAGVDNRCVEALRDAITGWIDEQGEDVPEYVEHMLVDELDMVRRIAIYLVNIRWQNLGDLYSRNINSQLFDQGNFHEMYVFLDARFASFEESTKLSTFGAIMNIPRSEMSDDPDLLVRLMQKRWLSAITGKGFAPADSKFHQLSDGEGSGKPSKYPDFLSYHESRWGPGPSPYSPRELVAMAQGGDFVEILNDFEPEESWDGPTKRALVDALEEAVRLDPVAVLSCLPEFLSAKRCYQYGVINGFKSLWEQSDKEAESGSLSWDRAWPKLLEFMGQLIGDNGFWDEPALEEQDLTPTRDWIPGLIAEFLRAGTRNDQRAHSAELLPPALLIIDVLLAKATAVQAPDDDPMTQAINSQKGKAVEALFSHALRSARAADATVDDHAEAWREIAPRFDRELGYCREANFEFSTLAGAYLPNLQYLSSEWVDEHVEQIFPSDYLNNYVCTLGGLAFAQATRPTFILLRDNGVLDFALGMQLSNRHTRESLLQRIGLAYLSGDELLDSPRFEFIYQRGLKEDLQELASFFWSVSNQELDANQVTRIISFWRRCVKWSAGRDPMPVELLANLSRLSCYFDELRAQDLPLLQATVPHVNDSNYAWDLEKNLVRLALESPKEVSEIIELLLLSYKPTYDFRDGWQMIIRTLAERGERLNALKFAEQLNDLSGMDALYRELRSTD